MSSNDNDEKHVMHLKSLKIKIMINDMILFLIVFIYLIANVIK